MVVIDFGLCIWWLWVKEKEAWCCGGGDCFRVISVVVVG